MSATILVTCDRCGHTISPNTSTIEAAEHEARIKHNWQIVLYRYERHEVREIRCPTCHANPIRQPTPELTYVADPN